MNNSHISSSATHTHPDIQSLLRIIKSSVILYTIISFAAIAVLAMIHNNAAAATQPAWIHASIVAATSLLLLSFALRMTRGNSRAYLRIRITSAILVVAIAVIEAIPGSFPLWMKLEEGFCGLLLLYVVILLNSRRIRSAFTTK